VAGQGSALLRSRAEPSVVYGRTVKERRVGTADFTLGGNYPAGHPVAWRFAQTWTAVRGRK